MATRKRGIGGSFGNAHPNVKARPPRRPKPLSFGNAHPNVRANPPRSTTPAPTPVSTGPAPQGLPIDPIYTGQTSLLQKQRQDLLAQVPYQQNQLASEFGFLPGSTNVDPNNPYSRASLLQRSYQQGQRGMTNSMAARGQLYSGATQRGLDEGTFNYSRNQDSLLKSYQSSLNDLERQKTQGMFDLDQQQLDADSDRLTRAGEQDPVPNFTAEDIRKLMAAQNQKTPQQIQKITARSWSRAARRRRRSMGR